MRNINSFVRLRVARRWVRNMIKAEVPAITSQLWWLRTRAARKMQSGIRRFLLRMRTLMLVKKNKYALVIQRCWYGFRGQVLDVRTAAFLLTARISLRSRLRARHLLAASRPLRSQGVDSSSWRSR